MKGRYIYMILGIIFSTPVVAIAITIGIVIYEECYTSWSKILTGLITVIIVGGTLIGGAHIGTSLRNANIEKEYYGFTAVKETYETAVSDERISGLERLEITKIAISQNKALARRKVDMKKWYSFDITDGNKELILGL